MSLEINKYISKKNKLMKQTHLIICSLGLLPGKILVDSTSQHASLASFPHLHKILKVT